MEEATIVPKEEPEPYTYITDGFSDWDYALTDGDVEADSADCSMSEKEMLRHNSTFINSSLAGAYSCRSCSYSCDSQDQLQEHRRQHLTMTTLCCPHCPYKTLSDVHFARHVSDHEIEMAAFKPKSASFEMSVGGLETNLPGDIDWDTVAFEDVHPPSETAQAETSQSKDLPNAEENLKRKHDFNDENNSHDDGAETEVAGNKKLCVSDLKAMYSEIYSEDKLWRCPLCPFQSTYRIGVVQHVRFRHNESGKENEDNVHVSANSLVKSSNSNDCDSQPKASARKIVLASKSNNCQVDGKVKCPFCDVLSPNQVSHENHVTLCHINGKSNTSLQVSVEDSPSKRRVSSRPSTSKYKPKDLQVIGSLNFAKTQSEYIEPSDILDEDKSSDSESECSSESDSSSSSSSSPMREISAYSSDHKNVAHSVEYYLNGGSQKKYDSLQNRRGSFDTSSSENDKVVITRTTDVDECLRQSQTGGLVFEDVSYCCPKCDFTSITRCDFIVHIKSIHEKDSLFVCKSCPHTTTNLSDLTCHTRIGCPFRRLPPSCVLVCTLCHFATKYYKSLERHKKQCCKVLNEIGYDICGKHRCPFCFYRTYEIECYKEHLLNHIRKDVLQCPKCPFKTCRKDMYRWHLKEDHRIYPKVYTCPPCKFKTINWGLFEGHMSSHFPKRKKTPAKPLPPHVVRSMHKQIIDGKKSMAEFGLHEKFCRSSKPVSEVYVKLEGKESKSSHCSLKKATQSKSQSADRSKVKVPQAPGNGAIPDLNKKSRGRPRKYPVAAVFPKRPRGRPRKVPTDDTDTKQLDDSQLSQNSTFNSVVCQTEKDSTTIRTNEPNDESEYCGDDAPQNVSQSSSNSPNETKHGLMEDDDFLIAPSTNRSRTLSVTTSTPVGQKGAGKAARRSLVCPYCSSQYESDDALEEHATVHAELGRFICPVCNFSATKFCELQSHLSLRHSELCF